MFLLGTLLNANAQVPSYIPSNGLVGWWPFSANANDLSGNGNHGSLIGGASLSFDRFGTLNSSYTFDGINCGVPKGISLPSIVSNTGEYTINCWFQSIDSTKLDQSIINSYPHQYIGVGLQVNSSFLNKQMSYAGNGTWQILGTTNNWNIYNLHDWHTLTIVKNTNEIKYYQDAILVRTQPINLNFNVGGFTNIFVGAISINGGSQCYETFKGRIDDVGIWIRALDSNEIKRLYQGCTKSITQQPKDISTSSKTAIFNCNTNDTLQTYQWQILKNSIWTNLKDSAQFAGTKSNQLTVNQLLASNNGQKFRCNVSGKCINASSNIATLNYNCKGDIVKQPTNQGMFNGNATFTCSSNDTLINYQWQTNSGTGWNNLFNAGQYTGSNSNSLLVSNVTLSNNNQLFRCIVKGDCLTDTTSEVSLRVWGVGVQSEQMQAFKVYPNPTKGQVTIENGDIAKMIGYTVSIYNSIGQEVFQSNITQQQFSLDISQLGGNGLYFMELTDNNGNIVDFKKIVLQ